MMRLRIFFGSAAVLLGLVFAATAGAQMRPGPLAVGKAAPPLHLAQVIGRPEPGQLSWASLRGDVVVIGYSDAYGFASWIVGYGADVEVLDPPL